jgi:hypothetical protein
MRSLARWTLLAFFTCAAVYCWMAWMQSASHSAGPGSPARTEAYRERVLVFAPVSLCLFSIGVLFFIVLKPEKRRPA